MKLGTHLMIDGLSDHLNDFSASELEKILRAIPPMIDMKILIGPFSAEGVPENPGASAILVVDTSHISIHTFTKIGVVSMDVYSCFPYDWEKAASYLVKKFKCKTSTIRVIEREV